MVSTLMWLGVPARLASAEVRAAVEHAWVHDVPLRIAYDGARGITERNVRIEAVLLERTMTLLNCRDLDIDDERQIRMHQILRAEVLPGTRQASLQSPSEIRYGPAEGSFSGPARLAATCGRQPLIHSRYESEGPPVAETTNIALVPISARPNTALIQRGARVPPRGSVNKRPMLTQIDRLTTLAMAKMADSTISPARPGSRICTADAAATHRIQALGLVN